MSLKDIKLKIKSVDRTRKVTKAMESVSAVKMRKSQVRAITSRPYASSALSILERMSVSLASLKHPLTVVRPVKKAAIVVVTSDKGLCGILNAAVVKSAYTLAESLELPREAISIYAFGRKGAEFFDRRGYQILGKFENVSDDVSVADLALVSNDIARAFLNKEFDRVDVVYTNFKSTFEQSAIAHKVLPLSIETVSEIVSGIVPVKGKFAVVDRVKGPASYTAEPSTEVVVDALIPRLVSVLFFHALLESKASEHSARMVAMKNASDKSRDLSKLLTRKYNKARQALITREVSEIVGGIEAMATS
ncbi:MAG: ATP synthase F1 subunit gamma [Candidatus Pacebacteria bacterium]|nr:ATP synthase F1 subunit gamma [Candidatus Paceibacterota bacterium]MBP9831921.1 ATP synthase F1 subunit gamma [Candidatus Paceibacterota bacterium]